VVARRVCLTLDLVVHLAKLEGHDVLDPDVALARSCRIPFDGAADPDTRANCTLRWLYHRPPHYATVGATAIGVGVSGAKASRLGSAAPLGGAWDSNRRKMKRAIPQKDGPQPS